MDERCAVRLLCAAEKSEMEPNEQTQKTLRRRKVETDEHQFNYCVQTEALQRVYSLFCVNIY